ncbi:MAG: Uncharacterised protein [Synechococcus sp. MIT S9220]|nr:MAG: Uncharacterised protein [Synechococcus sp. MIT S9220]
MVQGFQGVLVAEPGHRDAAPESISRSRAVDERAVADRSLPLLPAEQHPINRSVSVVADVLRHAAPRCRRVSGPTARRVVPSLCEWRRPPASGRRPTSWEAVLRGAPHRRSQADQGTRAQSLDGVLSSMRQEATRPACSKASHEQLSAVDLQASVQNLPIHLAAFRTFRAPGS